MNIHASDLMNLKPFDHLLKNTRRLVRKTGEGTSLAKLSIVDSPVFPIVLSVRLFLSPTSLPAAGGVLLFLSLQTDSVTNEDT